MNTGKQINAMVIVLFLSLIAVGAYTLWDPARSDSAENRQLEKAAEFGAIVFTENCRLCHGDAGQGGSAGGRLPASLPLDTARLQTGEEAIFRLVINTIACGRAGKAMPTWSEAQGGILNDEQIRQLAVMLTEGRWDLAQAHADEVDAATTNHATVQVPGGSVGIDDTELVVSNAGPFNVDQYIRIENERLLISEIPSTGQRLAEVIGRTPRRFLVSGANGIEVGAIVRLDGELMEVTAVRDDGDAGIKVAEPLFESSVGRISVSDPAFFRAGYVARVGDELIEVRGPVETGQTLGETVGRAETTLVVSGTDGIRPGMVIRMEEELLRVTEIIEPARLEVERGVGGTAKVAQPAGLAIIKVLEEPEEGEAAEDPDTGQTLLEPVGFEDTSLTVTGTARVAVGETFQLGDELVGVVDLQPARVRVERGVDGTSRAAHSRRVDIFEGSLLEVDRGVDGTQASAHEEGEPVFLTALEVKRAAAGSDRAGHSQGADIFLGNRLIVERGVLNTEAAAHQNGVLVRDFPPPQEDPTILGQACGQIAGAAPPPADTGPTPTPIEGALPVPVSLQEFQIVPEVESIVDGPVEFQATNDGTIVHNLRVIDTDLALDELPMDAAGLQVDETLVDVVGGFEEALDGGESRNTSFMLPPGSYILICNIATHYQSGMRIGFEVTAP